MKTDKYSDRMDVDRRIPLLEGGVIIRDPETNKCIIYKPQTFTQYISFDEVLDVLNEAPEGYFTFIGSDRETVLRELDNEHLIPIVHSLEQYGGYFELNI